MINDAGSTPWFFKEDSGIIINRMEEENASFLMAVSCACVIMRQ